MVESIVQRLNEMHRREDSDLALYLYESIEDYTEKNKNFQIGDIVFSKYYSIRSRKLVAKHPIMVITRVDDKGDYVQYEGLPLKTDHGKSEKYVNSIPIDDYSSILEPDDPDANYPIGYKSFIDVQDLAKFRSYDIERHRYAYVGHAKDEFYNFAMEARDNYLKGKSNKDIRWSK